MRLGLDHSVEVYLLEARFVNQVKQVVPSNQERPSPNDITSSNSLNAYSILRSLS